MKMGGIGLGVLFDCYSLKLGSCEDKAMAATIRAEKADIDRLEGVENQLKEQLKGDPPGNPSAELAQLEIQLEGTKAEIAALEEKRDGSEDSRDALVKEFEAYPRKGRVAE